ncbi:pentatricopeptide repeat-containing protein At1g71210, mitochondrial [Juglans microcarpa x Juglans regia]|uniref:pentatricopeptide repeat-containing protein At1g71210, mitochondrial n=1 Tax=Juglans microcarpa x Juglans regia TaxID=2249226 RepID=UPI001B7F48DD|nr:pentatricopeptide repeat-containing protein At1g71210, mitochondrial [Juglans microcarpa x Juglans regia]
MLSLKHVAKSNAFLSRLATVISTSQSLSSSLSLYPHFYYTASFSSNQNTHFLPASTDFLASSFKDWFKLHNNQLLDRIFGILGAQADDDLPSRRAADLALSQLGLRLSESFVLEVLGYGSDVLSCLKFFDWAGRQPGFHHTRATFYAIFKILSKAKLMSLMLDILHNYKTQRYFHRVRFYDTLVMGYAVAGKPDIALQVFGRMRFQGLDLDSFSYHVLLNALVEESCFDAVDAILKQIQMRGFENGITHSITVKNYCKQNRLDEAEAFLRGLMSEGRELDGHGVSGLVDALCKSNEFEKAGKLVEEFRESGMVAMENAYGVWMRDLVQAGRLDGALEFLRSKKSMEGYVPEVFRYNVLLCRLLRENRLEELCDLLMEMKEGQISPDKVTMNAALCFFCKAGMVDVALKLYNLRFAFGLSLNSMAYNYLINTLCGDGSIDEAYRVLKNSIDQGYFPGRKMFSVLADALCREGKLDKMKELLMVALQRNFMPSTSIYDRFISALCKARRVEDGYLIHGELNRMNKVTSMNTYFNLIHGFNKSNRGDIAARLLIEMQERGHTPTRALFRAVIRCLCDMENPEKQFLKLLEIQLSHHEPNCELYNFFIDGAGHAKRPELAREVFEMMRRSGVEPNRSSHILMLQSYLKSERISDALNFFRDLHQRRKIGGKLYNPMVVGLCKVNKVDVALDLFGEMRDYRIVPSIQCYESLIKLLCSSKKYDTAINLINDLEKLGRHVTSFIGNVLLFHSLKTQELYETWIRLREVQDESSSGGTSMLGLLVGAFSGRVTVSQHIDNLEEVIEKCFPLDTYTYNLLLRRLSRRDMDLACEYFNRMCKRGYEPNRWTYDILVHGFLKRGKKAEARIWLEEMLRNGFDPTEGTINLMGI